jgi:hypothetical protein
MARLREDRVMRCILHVGVHRTGTTSIQRFLREHLGAPGFPFGHMEPDLHFEIGLYGARPERVNREYLEATYDVPTPPDIERMVRGWIDAARAAGSNLVLSSETISYLRFADEIDRVVDLFEGAGADDIEVIFVQRDPASFLESYRLAMAVVEHRGLDNLSDITEISEDSWLVDYEARIALWERRCRVHVFDLETAVAEEGSIIPSVARVVGIDPVEYRLNSSNWIKSEIAKALRREQH